MSDFPSWWCVGKATEAQLHTEYLKREMDDIMPFSDYKIVRSLVLDIVDDGETK